MGWRQPFEFPEVAEGRLVDVELAAFVHSQQVITTSHPEDLDMVSLGQV